MDLFDLLKTPLLLLGTWTLCVVGLRLMARNQQAYESSKTKSELEEDFIKRII